MNELSFNRPGRLPAFVFLALAVGSAGAAERQVLRRQMPAAAARAQAVGRLAADQRVNFAIALPLRNPEALTNLLAAVYDPASPRFRRFLTPEQFAAQFGPSAQDYQAVLDYARTNGFTVARAHPNRTLVTLNAAVADIERAFHVTLRTYRHPTENRTFRAPDADPSLNVAVPVLTVCGLDDFTLPRPLSHVQPLSAGATNATPLAGSGIYGSYLGYDFRAAYYATNGDMTGAGQSVGLLQFDGYFTSDIAAYKSQAGLPDVVVTNVLLDGFDGNPVSYGGNGEVSLDIEMAISMAPGLDRVIVYEADPYYGVPTDILNRMATDNAAKQLSSSWTWAPRDAAADQIFEQMALQGQSFFQASGDSGAYSGSSDEPTDDPYITIVGGTTLNTSDPIGPWASENAWTSGGGGISTIYPLPAWQRGIDMTVNGGSTAMRNFPDVALIAENVYVKCYGGSNSYGIFSGTSCAAPLWAGFTALINQQAAANAQPPVGFINPVLYAIGRGANGATAFHDIVIGNNTNASGFGFSAMAGYDLCAGWGTPNGSNLINAVVSYNASALRVTPVTRGATFTGPPGGPFNPSSASLLLTNIGLVAVDWRAGDTSTWFAVAPSGGTLSAGGATNITVTLTATATGLVSGTYFDAAWITNLFDGTVLGRSVELLVYEVQNGDFEAGSDTNWVSSGYVGNNLVFCKDDTYFNGYDAGSTFVHSGEYGMFLGGYGALGYISQTLQTISGRPYLLSFWLTNPWSGTPNEFLVQWGGNTLFDQTDLGQLDWTNMQFVVLANDTTTVLTFGARNDPNAFGLDDISAQLLVLPVFDWLAVQTNAATLMWSASTNVHYQAQYTTNLTPAQWIDLGAPVLGTSDTMTITDPLPESPQRFYRVLLQP
jgi:hypothetical protein